MTDKAATTSGWLVRVTTDRLGGGPPGVEDFIVAIAAIDAALLKIQEQKSTTPDQRVEALRRLLPFEIARHNLKPGDVKQHV